MKHIVTDTVRAGDRLALVEKARDVTKEAACRVADLIGTLPVRPVTSQDKTGE